MAALSPTRKQRQPGVLRRDPEATWSSSRYLGQVPGAPKRRSRRVGWIGRHKSPSTLERLGAIRSLDSGRIRRMGRSGGSRRIPSAVLSLRMLFWPIRGELTGRRNRERSAERNRLHSSAAATSPPIPKQTVHRPRESQSRNPCGHAPPGPGSPAFSNAGARRHESAQTGSARAVHPWTPTGS